MVVLSHGVSISFALAVSNAEVILLWPGLFECQRACGNIVSLAQVELTHTFEVGANSHQFSIAGVSALRIEGSNFVVVNAIVFFFGNKFKIACGIREHCKK